MTQDIETTTLEGLLKRLRLQLWRDGSSDGDYNFEGMTQEIETTTLEGWLKRLRLQL